MTTVTVSPATVKTDGATYTYDGRRIANSMWNPADEWSLTDWLAQVEASDLPRKVKDTARAMAASATSRGYTTIDNQTLADFAQVSRIATMTARLKQIRAAGFLESTARFNTSSLHRLTNPHGNDPHPLDAYVKDITPLAPGEVF